jgi:hypothetical protein
MANKVYTYYKELPSWAKGVVVVGGIAIVYFTAKQIIKRIRTQAERKFDLQESDSASSDLQNLAQQGIKPTISNSQIDNIINSLVEAMNDCGTNEETVYNQFKKLNNTADVYALLKRWQIRYYRPCAVSNPISFAKYQFNNKAFGGNLSTWLTYDMTATEIGKINKILSDKRINYKF